jgi:hypothetical protein
LPWQFVAPPMTDVALNPIDTSIIATSLAQTAHCGKVPGGAQRRS